MCLFNRILLVAALVLGAASPVAAQPPAFSPTGNLAALAVTTVSARVPFGAVASVQLVQNTGPNVAYCLWGDANVVATTSKTPVFPGQTVSLSVGANTNIACITVAGTTNIAITSGEGVPGVSNGLRSMYVTPLIFKGALTIRSTGCATTESVGGLISLSGLVPNQMYYINMAHLAIGASTVTTAGQMEAVAFDANPSASTITDGSAMVVNSADESNALWLGNTAGNAGGAGTLSPVYYELPASTVSLVRGIAADPLGRVYVAFYCGGTTLFVGARGSYRIELRQ